MDGVEEGIAVAAFSFVGSSSRRGDHEPGGSIKLDIDLEQPRPAETSERLLIRRPLS